MLLKTPADFPQQHRSDRWFFPLAVAVIWVVILLGFVPDVVHRLTRGAAPYPLVIHLHAVIFVGWLMFLSVQVVLIRARRHDLHRRLGLFGAALAAAMVVVGPWAGIVDEQVHFGTPEGDPPFLSAEFMEMLVFTVQVAAALWLRRDASAHKRLMLLATLFLTTAGFGRWLAEPLYRLFGDGFLPFFLEFFAPATLLVLGLGAYDLATRRRLHPAYVVGAASGIAGQVIASWLYVSPAWKAVALKVIGH